jgi:hypothetical protein
MKGYDHAYHVTNWTYDDEAILAYTEKLNDEIAQYSAKTRDPLESTAVTVDDFKEEAENPTKHFWCIARDTVFVYDNRFKIAEMPNFVVCDPTAELRGEEPGDVAAAGASGSWIIGKNGEGVTYVEPKTDKDYVTRVKGLKPGETQFTWKVTRWECKDSADVFVYYNKVVSKAGDDVYTCTNEATLSATEPQAPGEGRWDLTQSSDPDITFDDPTKFNTRVSKLKQGENRLQWIVESPQPPFGKDANGNSTGVVELIEGHRYSTQEGCPTSDEMTVHNLRPDDAVIKTGEKIKPTPSPGP